jgi:putative redox protein
MITVTSKKEKYAMEATNGKVNIMADIPESHGGSGKYLAPFELLCSSFAACLTATARLLLEKRGVAYDKVTAKVDVDHTSTPGKTAFTYHLEIEGNIPEADKKKYVQMVFNGCPIHKALGQTITFTEMH